MSLICPNLLATGTNIRYRIGGTGHVGGAVLDAIVKRYPDVNVDVLVRDSEKAAAVKKLYPKVNTVIGSLGDLSLLQESAKKTDIVICKYSVKISTCFRV